MKHETAILAVLPGTLKSITAAVGLDRSYISRTINEFLKAGKLHIGRRQEWTGAPGPAAAIYYAGPGQSVPSIKPMTRQEIAIRQEARREKRRGRYQPLPTNLLPIVEQALRTQPNSVWQLAGIAA